MRRHLPLYALALLIVLVGLAPIELRADPLRITIDEAAARAAAENLDLRAAGKDVDVARGELTRNSAVLPFNPFLSGGTQTRPQGAGVAGGVGYYFGYLSQEFEIAGQYWARAEAARKAVDKEQSTFQDAKRSLVASVKTNFIKALAADQRLELARQAAADSERLRNSGNFKKKTDSELIESNSARIDSARFEGALTEAEEDRDTAYEALRHQLALAADSEIELVGRIPDTVEPQPALADLIDQATLNRADLQALRAAEESTAAQVKLENRRRFPNVTLSGTVARFEGDTLFGGEIGFPLPVFHTNSGEVQLAVAEHERTEIQIRDLQRQIEQEVRAAYRTCATKGAAVNRYRDTVIPLSEENVRLQQRLWDRDESNEVDYLGAKLEMLSARGEYVDALEDYETARIELDRLLGRGLVEPATPLQP